MKPRKYTRDTLEPIISKSESISDVLRAFGVKCSGGNFRLMKQRIIESGLDISHFKGQSWAKGLTAKTEPRLIRKTSGKIFTKNTSVRGQTLRSRMLQIGIKYQCDICGNQGIWNERPLTLHIDHQDGDNMNNEIGNLRFVCPNCHQQTPTWGNNVDEKLRKYPKKICPKCGVNSIGSRAKQCRSCYGLDMRKNNNLSL